MFKGSKLKEARENKELTQEEVAKLVGITQGSYAHFEKQRRVPSKELVAKFCEIFGVQEPYFYGEEIDKVRELINELKKEGILREAEDVSGDTAALILDSIKSELRIEKLKKEQGK